MDGCDGQRSPPPIRSVDPCRHARGSSSSGGSSSRRPPALFRFVDSPDLPPPRQPQRTNLYVSQRSWGGVGGKKHRSGDPYMEVDGIVPQGRARLPRIQLVVGLVPRCGGAPKLPGWHDTRPPRPAATGGSNAATAREDREARKHITAEGADEAYMADLREQHLELVEAERAIFTEHGWEVILISDDDEQGGNEGGEENEFNIEEWRWMIPDDDIEENEFNIFKFVIYV